MFFQYLHLLYIDACHCDLISAIAQGIDGGNQAAWLAIDYKLKNNRVASC